MSTDIRTVRDMNGLIAYFADKLDWHIDLDDFDEDDDDIDNYYGTCFEHKYDEPDDGCVKPYPILEK